MNIAELIKQTAPCKPEKRKHRRISLRLPVEYSLSGSSLHRLAYTVDISEGGVLMRAPEKLEIGQNLMIRFYYGSDSGIHSIHALGEVIRVDRMGRSGKDYSCAVKFFDPPSDVLKELRKFLKSLY